MEKDGEKISSFKSTFWISILFIIWTAAAFFIAYKNIDYPYSFKIMVGYVIFTLLFICYILLMAVIKTKKMQSTEIKKRLLRFVILFIIIGAVSLIIEVIVSREGIGYLKVLSSSFGVSLGIAFFDVLFYDKNK